MRAPLAVRQMVGQASPAALRSRQHQHVHKATARSALLGMTGNSSVPARRAGCRTRPRAGCEASRAPRRSAAVETTGGAGGGVFAKDARGVNGPILYNSFLLGRQIRQAGPMWLLGAARNRRRT